MEYCWPDRSLGWQKGLEWAVVGETVQFVEEGETSYCASVLKGGQPCTVTNDVDRRALRWTRSRQAEGAPIHGRQQYSIIGRTKAL